MRFIGRFLPASILGLVFWAMLSSAVVLPAPDQVTIDTGQMKGVVAGDVVSFKGIPYAAPPIGQPPAR